MLPESEWLAKAKSLAIGQTDRVRHRQENRANLVIGNERGKWWGYCQRCKQGGVVEKAHVALRSAAPVEENILAVPGDMVPVIGSAWELQVSHFLIAKGMAYPYLPKLWVSPKVSRLLLQCGQSWHGRSLRGHSNSKWVHYDKASFTGIPDKITVVTEDLFSMFKMQYALRAYPNVSVCSTLGAGVSTEAALAMRNCHIIVWAYDADAAGDAGYRQAVRRMRGCVPGRQYRIRPPEGKDPKDMQIQELRDAFDNLRII